MFFLIVVTVGGAGSLWGAFVAALLLGFLDNAGKYLWPDGGAFFIYIATVALLLRKPDGLFGRAAGLRRPRRARAGERRRAPPLAAWEALPWLLALGALLRLSRLPVPRHPDPHPSCSRCRSI